MSALFLGLRKRSQNLSVRSRFCERSPDNSVWTRHVDGLNESSCSRTERAKSALDRRKRPMLWMRIWSQLQRESGNPDSRDRVRVNALRIAENDNSVLAASG